MSVSKRFAKAFARFGDGFAKGLKSSMDGEPEFTSGEWQEDNLEWGRGDGRIVLHDVICSACNRTIPLITSERETTCKCGRKYFIEYVVKAIVP